MNEAEVDRQINQMVQFIKQEAEEKANEIRVAAEEEFNIEKLQMVESERQKIRKEFERKESQVEVKKKIEYSTQLNAMRLKVLTARDEAMQAMLSEVRAELTSVSSSPGYKALLTGLILQGAKKLETKAAVVRCRECDVAVVKEAMAEAEAKVAGMKLVLDTHVSLPPPPDVSKEGVSCVGGVHVISMDGKIICNNSLDDRLNVAYERNLPEIRSAIFGVNPNLTQKTAKAM